MIDCVKGMINGFSIDFGPNNKAITPAIKDLFKVNNTSLKIDNEEAKEFHAFVAKGLFVYKRAQPVIYPTIAFLYASKGS